MPVPVPSFTNSTAQSAIKSKSLVNHQTLTTQSAAAGTHAVSAYARSQAAFRSDDWSSTLPSWRRSSQQLQRAENQAFAGYRVQDFYQGLTAADNASVIKGSHAEACIPPLFCPTQASFMTGPIQSPNSGLDDDMDEDDAAQFDSEMQWGVDVLVGNDDLDQYGATTSPANSQPASSAYNASYHAGAFSPIYEDQSPGSESGPDSGSSPVGPITPFCDFVDRAVAHAQSYATLQSHYTDPAPTNAYYQQKLTEVAACQPPAAFPAVAQQPNVQAHIPISVGPAPPAVAYKKLSEPLSEWIAGYVWKVCTTGMNLPPVFAQPAMNAGPYAVMPPSSLASSIHTLLLATLLQPSGVFLAVWYIIRLPVYFAATPLSGEFVKERAFRSALFSDGYSGQDSTMASVAFRLVVLGCMLANKWLDDHTFSNKTWHSISNIPLQTLNKLEALVLDIFSYDLSISPQQWSQWLNHVMSYHMSLSSLYPQPIGRPSSNPHSIVRGAIEFIIHAPSTRKFSAGVPQPVFLGIEDRIKERQEKEDAMDELDIDLDEDGPIRAEYLPKRRASKLASQTAQIRDDFNNGRELPSIKALPPPAKWSPAGDEPIIRNRNRSSGQYLAVQPSNNLTTSYPTSYQPHDVPYTTTRGWNPPQGHLPNKSQTGYMYDPTFPAYHGRAPVYNHVGQVAPPHIPAHSRSQSLSFDQDMVRNSHMRSYSQSRFEYKQSDLLMMANEHVPVKDTATKWMEQANGYLCPSQAYIHIPSVGVQPTW